jgi:hypothetical protein
MSSLWIPIWTKGQGPNGSMVATSAALDDKGPLTLPAPNGAGQREARGCAADWIPRSGRNNLILRRQGAGMRTSFWRLEDSGRGELRCATHCVTVHRGWLVWAGVPSSKPVAVLRDFSLN